jgi:hypothetical protein
LTTTQSSPSLYLRGYYWASANYTFTGQIFVDVTGTNTGDLCLRVTPFGGGSATTLRVGEGGRLTLNNDDVVICSGTDASSVTDDTRLTLEIGGNVYYVRAEAG